MAATLSRDISIRNLIVERALIEQTINQNLSQMAALPKESEGLKNPKLLELINSLEETNRKIKSELEARHKERMGFWGRAKTITGLKVSSALLTASKVTSVALEIYYGRNDREHQIPLRLTLIFANYSLSALLNEAWKKSAKDQEINAKFEQDESTTQLHDAMFIAFANSYNTFGETRKEEDLKLCLENYTRAVEKKTKTTAFELPNRDDLASALIYALPEDHPTRRTATELFDLACEPEAEEKEESKTDTEALRKAPSLTRRLTLPEKEALFNKKWQMIRDKFGISGLRFHKMKITKEGNIVKTDQHGKEHVYNIFSRKTSFLDVLPPPTAITTPPAGAAAGVTTAPVATVIQMPP